MDVAFQIASIILAVVLTVLILLQIKGDGMGLLGGDMGGITRTRRGLEKTLFQITVGVSITFLIVCILSVVTFVS